MLAYLTRHKTLANLLMILMLGAGLAALPNMRAQFFPDVVSDEVSVSVRWDGAGAEDVDRGIVQVLEPVLLSVEGVNEAVSISREGRASIELEFETGRDISEAANDVKAALDAVTGLPEGIDDPTVQQGRWTDRVTDVVISGPVGIDQLARLTDAFVASLFEAGVTRSTIRGIAAPEVMVEIPSAELLRNDVSLRDVAAAIRAEAATEPAGDVSGGGARIRTGEERREAEDVAAIVVRRGEDGTSLTVGDLGRVTSGGIDRERAYFVGDRPALSVQVARGAAGDAIELQAIVQQVADEVLQGAPAGVEIELIRTRTEAITARINVLVDNAVMGLGLVVLLLFLFLNARTAFWVAAGIPVAMMAAIALMWAAGLTINMISLFALIITLGIVVDDAIVVGEHADFRARVLGEPPETAAANAARRMFTPVLSATLTTVIAFFGLIAIGGRFGDLISAIPFTVIVVLIASLAECFLILPHHMAGALKERSTRTLRRPRAIFGFLAVSIVSAAAGLGGLWGATVIAGLFGVAGASDWLSPVAIGTAAAIGLTLPALVMALSAPDRRDIMARTLADHGVNAVSTTVNVGFTWMRDTAIVPLIGLAIRARYAVLAGALVLMASQAALFLSGEVPWRFFNAPEQGSITGNFALRDGASREEAIAQMREMQRAVEVVAARYEAEHGRNPVDFVMGEVGGNSGRGLASADDKEPSELGAISIELIDADLRPYSSFAFLGDLQDEVRTLPATEELSFRGWRSGPGGDALSVRFVGADIATLKQAAEDLKTAVARFPEVSAVEDSLPYDKDELVLELTPQGEALGFDIDALGEALRDRLTGIEAASFPVGPRTGTIRVELPPEEIGPGFLETLRLATPNGGDVALADIVTVQTRSGFGSIRREGGVPVVTVTGDIDQDNATRANEIRAILADDILPAIAAERQVAYTLGGLAEQEEAFLTDATLGFIACLAGIFLVLAWIFASWTRPLVIMAVIPFGLIGAVFGHWWWDVPLSMFSVVGLIGMTGIIINDSIVLVTTVDEYSRTRALRPAIIDAVRDRFRPVMLTTLTTVLGLTPLLYETSSQAQWLRPTVITLAYGLGFGMLLVLVLVPALLAMGHDFSRMTRALRRMLGLAGRRRGRGLGLLAGVAVAAILGWGGVVLGPAVVGGGLLSPLAANWPIEGMPGAVALFLAGVAALLVVLWLLAALAQLVLSRGERGTPIRPQGQL